LPFDNPFYLLYYNGNQFKGGYIMLIQWGRRILPFLAMVLLLNIGTLFSVKVFAASSVDGQWEYSLSGINATITRYSGTQNNLTIPASIDGYPVVAIGASAFANNASIRTVSLPTSMRTIGEFAFRNCSGLQSISLNEGLTVINRGAFNGCISLGSITIPNSVTTLNSENNSWNTERRTFGGCTSLATVTIGTGLQDIQAGTFYGNTSLREVNFGQVVTIGDSAFRGCTALTTLRFGNRLQIIGANAFFGCTALVNVSLPTSMRIINEYAFRDCTGLQTISLNEGLTTIHRGAFNNCRALTVLTIPHSVTTINSENNSWYPENRTFGGCTSLSAVAIGNGLREIQAGTFYGCTNLQQVNLGQVITIGASAFRNCTSLRNISFGPVVTLGESAFQDCTSIETVNFGNSLVSIGGSAFSGCRSLSGVTLPATTRTISEFAFRDCIGLRTLSLNEGLTSINRGAFNNCTSLTTLTIPNSVTTINSENNSWYPERRTFGGCTGLTAVTIGTGLREIQTGTFYGCTSLRTVNMSQVVTIGTSAFNNCTALDALNLGSTLVTIGSEAFFGCRNLINVTLPSTVITINEYAFRNCTGLRNLSLNEGLVTIHRGAFSGCSALNTLAIPNSVTTINSENNSWYPESRTFGGCTSLTSVTLGNSLQQIQAGTFYGCTQLVNVTIGNRVQSVGNSAFQHCNRLSNAVFLGNAPTLGTNVFDSVASDFTIYYYPGASGWTTPFWNNLRTVMISSLNTAPVIAAHPSDQTVAVGQSAVFTVAASGSPSPAYQWQLSTNGGGTWTPITGATANTLTLQSVSAAMNGYRYRCVVSNTAGSVNSNAAMLTVTSGGSAATPVLIQSLQPIKLESIVPHGSRPIDFLTVNAAAPDGGTLSYSWYWNHLDTGQYGFMGITTSGVMPWAGPGDPGMYRYDVLITNTRNGVQSAPLTVSAHIWIVTNPVIAEMPIEIRIQQGTAVELSALVTTQDSSTLFFWWHRTSIANNTFDRLTGAVYSDRSPVNLIGTDGRIRVTDTTALAPGTYLYELLIFNVRALYPDGDGIIGNGTPFWDTGASDWSYTGTWSAQKITVIVE
jgi:hypothetical protein